MRSVVALVVALAASATACAGDDETAPRVATYPAPAQDSSLLAAVRLEFGNPPHLDLVTLAPAEFEPRAVVEAPRSDDPPIRRIEAPAWSPDATQLYFTGVTAEREGDRFTYYESDVFGVAAGGGEITRITRLRDASLPAPSPDGKAILVTRIEHPGQRPFTSGLWLTDADGSNERRLVGAEEGVIDISGSWTPDGHTIAFTRCPFRPPDERGMQENTCDVYTVSSDGSGLQKLTDRASMPAFSPDGQRIAFVSDRDENGTHRTGSDEQAFANELYVMEADGDDLRRLTETASLDEETPSWYPDGSLLAYAREGPGSFRRQLMLIRDDGTCPTHIAGDAAETAPIEAPSLQHPSWRPGSLLGNPPDLDCS